MKNYRQYRDSEMFVFIGMVGIVVTLLIMVINSHIL